MEVSTFRHRSDVSRGCLPLPARWQQPAWQCPIASSNSSTIRSAPWLRAESTWSNISLAGVIGVIVAVTILALVMVISALLTHQQVAPALADVTPIAATSDANASGETRKAA